VKYKTHHHFFYELFRVYKIQRFILIEVGLILIAASIVPLVEQSAPHARIQSFSDGLWWALVTVTSTGYGDLYPVTAFGKIIAVLLMFSGITIFSTMIGLVAFFISRRRSIREFQRLSSQIENIDESIDKINKKIDFLIKK
jgi:voltage-gated potassium channel